MRCCEPNGANPAPLSLAPSLPLLRAKPPAPRSMAMQGAKVMINDLKKGVSKGAGAVDAGTRDGDNQEARLVSDGDG